MMEDKLYLTPEEILDHEFKIDARGYRMQEVDKFLDMVIRDYTEFLRTIKKLEKDNLDLIEDNKKLQAEYRKLKASIEALGYDKQPIRYGHMSIIVDETGKKLSKRNKALKQFIEDYRNMGFPFEGIDNFLALLGWSDKNNKEILSLDELVKVFDFDRLSKSPAYFDYKKMLWISNEYIKKM